MQSRMALEARLPSEMARCSICSIYGRLVLLGESLLVAINRLSLGYSKHLIVTRSLSATLAGETDD